MNEITLKAQKLIENAAYTIIASLDQAGYPNVKAMLPPRKHSGLSTFYFTTNTSSQRVSQYRKDPKASIYFCDSLYFKGLMLIGSMEVLEDRQAKELIWRPGDELYYPLGVSDPDYCVLRFTAIKGHYYDNLRSYEVIIESP